MAECKFRDGKKKSVEDTKDEVRTKQITQNQHQTLQKNICEAGTVIIGEGKEISVVQVC